MTELQCEAPCRRSTPMKRWRRSLSNWHGPPWRVRKIGWFCTRLEEQTGASDGTVLRCTARPFQRIWNYKFHIEWKEGGLFSAVRCMGLPYNVRYEKGKGNSDHEELTEEEMEAFMASRDILRKRGSRGHVNCSTRQCGYWCKNFSAPKQKVSVVEKDSEIVVVTRAPLFEV